ncbi:MAG TPA: ribosome silencing factor [Burkholderiaceae bacterium]|nr:ribosome silencing factor [Burkholderiaceae bacterium]
MDLRKLQRVIVDALEDIKGQDIKVFNTEHLSDMFERVIVASGTSNRQTRALASSVVEKVKQAGGYVVSVEGEDSGEWVLVDCGEVVVHVLQPTFRAYYNLEEIWGGKPVRLRAPAPATGIRPAVKKSARKAASKAPAKPSARPPAKARAKAPVKAPARTARRRAA